MTAFNSTYILSSAAQRREIDLFLNIQLQGALVSYLGQNATVVGTNEVDAVFARAGVSVDFTASGAGVDKLYLDGNLSDYTIATSAGVVTLTRAASASIPASTYKLKLDGNESTDDAVIFANGATTVLALSQAAATPVVLNAAQTSLAAPTILGTPPSTTESVRVRLDTAGTVISAVTDPMLIIAGSSAVDVVYVNAGSQVDARGLGGSVDQIYLTGNWSDYTKTITGKSIEFSRTVGGNTEHVWVAAGTGLLNDQVYFADGNISSNSALNAIRPLTSAAAIAALSLADAGGTIGGSVGKTPIASLAEPSITAISNDTAAADFVTSHPSQTITGTYAGQLRAGDKIQVQVGTGAWQDALVTPTSPTGGTFSLAGVTLTAASTVVNARTVGLESNWAVSTSGATNNTKYAASTKTITLDTDGPSGTLLPSGAGLAADAYANAAEATVSLEISTADLKKGDKVQLQVAGSNVGSVFEVTQADLDRRKIVVSVARADLTEGANSVTAVFTDLAGNTSTSPVYTLTRDTQVPTLTAAVLSPTDAAGVSFTGVANDAYLNIAETAALIKVSATPGTTGFALGDTVKVYNGTTVVGTAVVDATAAQSGNVYVTVPKDDLGSDGLKTLTVVASDAAGNTSTAPAPVSVTVDTQIPTPVLRISSTDAQGASLVQDNLLAAAETQVVLEVTASPSGTAFKAGDVVQLVQVTSATGVTPVTTTPLLHADGTPYAPVTIAADGGKAYFDFLKADLPTGTITLRAHINDVAANTADSGLLSITTGLTITNAAMVAGTVTALDVHADIILIASAALDPVGIAGKSITFTNTAVTTGYQSENQVNTFTVDVTDTRFVSFDPAHPERIIVKPPFDFDFGNRYTITVDAGAFQVPGGALANLAVTTTDALHFATVAVTGSSVATANQGQTLNADGTLNPVGKKWINVDGLGDPDAAAVSLDLSGGDYALVLLDRSTTGGTPLVNDGVGARGTHLNVTNWGPGDMIYADDQANNVAAINQKAQTQVYENFTGTSLQTVWFDANGGTNKQAQININSLDGGGSTLTEAQVLAQINVANTRYGTPVTAARTDTVSGTDIGLVGNNVDATHPAVITVTGAFRDGDKVDLEIYDAFGQRITLTPPVAQHTVTPTEAGNHAVDISVTSFAGLTHGQMYYVSTQVTDKDGAVTHSPTFSLSYRTRVDTPVLSLDATSNDLTIDSAETGIDLHLDGNTLNFGDKVELKLGGDTITTGITAGSSTIANGVITVGAAEISNGITWTVAKASLPDYQNNVTVNVSDGASNFASSNALRVDVPAYVGISGVVGAGPVVAGNDLIAKAYDANGNLLGQDTTVTANGAYTVNIRADYTGPVLIEVTSQGAATDFRDEHTRAATDLSSYTLRAVTAVTANTVLLPGAVGNVAITTNVTTLTDLAAQKVLGTNAKLVTGLTAEAVTAINTQVAQQFLGVAAEVITQTPNFTVDAAGTNTASSADRYGQVLKQLSDLAANNGGNINAAQAAVAAQITWSPAAPSAAAVLDTGAKQLALLAKVALNADASSPPTTGVNALTIQDLTDLGVANAAALTAPRQTKLLADIVAGTSSTVGNVAALQQLSNQVTSMGRIFDLADGVTATAPVAADYATVGISGVTSSNLAAVNLRIADASSAALPTVDAITAVVTAGVAANTAALSKLELFAGTSGAPTVADYVDAGVTGVTANNLSAVNARVAAAAPGAATSSTLVQALATAGATAQVQAFVQAVNFAIDPVNTAPTVSSLRDLGVVGVTTASGVDAVKALLPQLNASAATPAALTEQITNAVLPTLQPVQAAAITPGQLATLSPSQIGLLPVAVVANLAPQQVLGLSNLAALSPTQIEALSPAVLAQLSSAQQTQVSPSLSTAQQAVVADIQAAANVTPTAAAALTAAQVDALSPATVSGLSPAAVASLSPAAVASLDAAQVGAITPAQAAQITSSQVDSLSALQVAALAPDAVASLSAAAITSLDGAQVAALTSTQAAQITPAQIDSLNANQLAALSSAALSGLSPAAVASLDATQAVAITATQVDALSAAQVAAINPAAVSVLSASAVSSLDAAQVAAITPTQAAQITATQVDVLSQAQVAALAPSALASLSAAAITSLDATQVAAITPAQASSITATQVDSLSAAQVRALSPAALAGLSAAAVASLDATQAAAITATQVDALSAAQVAAISPAALAALSTTAMASMDVTQVAALTSAQLAVLTSAQVQALPATALSALSPSQLSVISANLSAAQTTAVAEIQAAAAITPTAAADLTSGQVDALSPAAVSGLTPSAVGSLSAAAITSLDATQVAAITPTQAAQVTAAQVDALSAAQVGALAPSAVASLSAAAITSLDATQVAALTPAQAAQVTASQVDALSAAQVGALTPAAVASLSAAAITSLSAAQVAAITPAQAAQVTAAQVDALSASQVGALTPAAVASLSAAAVASLSAAQVAVITASQVDSLSASQVAAMAPAAVASLSAAALASLDAAQVGAITASQAAQITDAQVDALSASQLGALTPAAVASLALATVASLDVAQVAAITPEQAAQVTAAQVDALAPDQVAALSPSAVARISATAVASLDVAQVAAITPEQAAQVTPEQVAALNPTAIVGLSAAQVGGFTSTQLAALTTAQIAALDASGDLAQLTATQRMLLVNDTTAPAVTTLTAPTDFGVLGDALTHDATVTVGNLEAGASWQYSLNAGLTWATGTGTTIVLPEGSYGRHDIQVRQTDARNNTSQVQSLGSAITIDTQAPVAPAVQLVLDTGRLGSDGRTHHATATVSGIEPDATLQMQVDSGNWTPVSGNTVTLSEGTHTYALRQIDAAGNTGDASAAVSWTLDTTPTALLPSPESAYFVTDLSATLHRGALLQGKGAPAHGSVTITFSGLSPITVDSDASGNWSVQLPVSIAANTTATLSVTNDVGTASSGSTSAINLQVSNTAAPTLLATLAQPALRLGQDTGLSSGDGISTVTTPTLQGSGAQAGATITVYVDGVAQSTTATANSSGNWSHTLGSALGVGQHEIAVTQSASGFSTSARSLALSYNLDTAAPVAPAALSLSVDSGVLSDGATDDATPTLSGTAEANAQVDIRVDGVVVANVLADATGQWRFTPVSAMTDGNHQIDARQTDVAGNVGPWATALSLRVDTTAARLPAFTFTDDAGTSLAAAASTIDNRPTLSGSGAEAGATITVVMDNVTLDTITAASDGSWSFTPSTALALGQHSFAVRQTDTLGNTSVLNTAQTLTVVAAVSLAAPDAPVLAISSDSGTADDRITSDLTPTVSGTITNPESGMRVQVFNDSTLLGTTSVNAVTGVWSFTPSTDLATGQASLSAVLVDADGNLSAASDALSLTLNNAVPAALTAPVLSAGSDTGNGSSGSTSDGITRDRLPTFSGSGAPASATVQVLVNGSVVGSTTADTSGDWRFTPSSTLSTGALNITARAVSVSGVVGVASPALALTIDNSTATPALNASLSAASIHGGATLFGTAEANALVALAITPTGGSVQNVQVQANAQGVWTYTPSAVLVDGTYSVVLTATDVAGNTTSSAPAALTVSAAVVLPPSLVLVTASDTGMAGDGITNDTTPTFNISGISASATAVQISTNGGTNWSPVTYTAGQTTATYTPGTALAGSAAGTVYNVQVRQTVDGVTSLSSPTLPLSLDTVSSVATGTNAVALRNGGYLTATGLSLSTGLTIEAWLKLDNVNGAKNVFTLVDENNSANNIRFICGNFSTNAQPRLEGTLNGQNLNTSMSNSVNYSPVNGQWGHVALRISDTGTVNLVVNGTSTTGTAIGNFSTNMPSSTTWTLRVGASNTGNGTLSGLMRDLKVWDTVRANADIGTVGNTAATDRNTAATGTETGLVLYAPLNDAAGATGLFNVKTGSNSVNLVNGALAGTVDTGVTTNAPLLKSGPTVTLAGTAEAGAMLVISEGVNELARLTVPASGQWRIQLAGQTPGAHIYTVAATDAAGNASSATRDMTVFAAPTETPTITGLVSSSDSGVLGDSITNVLRPTIEGTGPLFNSLVQVLDGAGNIVASTLSDGSGHWRVILSNALSEGVNTLSARYLDSGTRAAGAPSTSVTFTLDTSVPSSLASGATLALSAGSDSGVLGDGITRETQPVFQGQGAPANAAVQVTFSASGQTPQTKIVQANGDGVFSVAPDAALFGGAGTVWQVTARVQNVAGTLGLPMSTSFTLDTQGLTGLAITAPAGSLSAAPFVSGTASATTDVLVYDNATNALLGRTTSDASGNWSVQLLSLSSNGNLTLRAQVQDAAGNTTSSTQAITIDTTVATPVAPGAVSALALSGSATGSLTSSSTPTLTGLADPGVTVKAFNGLTLVGTAVADSTGVFSMTLSTAVTGDGLKTLTIRPFSGAVAGESTDFSYTLDATAPAAPTALALALASDSGVLGDGITSVAQPVVTGTGVAGSHITLTVDGAVQTGTATVAADGTWSLAVDSALSTGAHSITAHATDAAGNPSTASTALTTTVRTGPPPASPSLVLDAASDSGFAGDGITSNTTPTFNISGIDAAATAVEISTNGGTSWSPVTYTAGQTTATYTLGTALTGSASGTAHNVQVRQTVGGDTSAGSIAPALTVDTGVAGLVIPAGSSFGFARYVMLRKNLGTALDLIFSEIQIYSNGVNIAPGKTLTTSESSAGGGAFYQSNVGMSTDGNLSSVVDLFNGNTNSNLWVQVDLGAVVPIDGVTLYGNGNSRATNMTVFTSLSDMSGQTYAALNSDAAVTKVSYTGAVVTNSGVTLTTSAETDRISGTAEAGAQITISLSGSVIKMVTADKQGAWTVSLADQTPGTRTYAVGVTDVTGNTSTSNRAVTVKAPTTVTISGLTSATDSGTLGDLITNAASPVLQGTASAADTVTVTANGTVLGSAVADSSGAWSMNLTGVANGNYVLSASNGSVTSLSAFMALDTLAPTLVSTTGLGAAGVAPTFSGVTEAGASVSLVIGGTPYGPVTANGSGSFTLSLTAAQFAAWGEGNHVAQLHLTDKAGNLTVSDFNWVKDTQTSVTVSAPSGTQGSSFALSGTAETGASVVVSDATDTTLGTVTAAGDGSWTLVLSNQTSGTPSYTVRATDAVGNTATQSVSVTVNASLLASPVLSTASDTGTLGDGITRLVRPTLVVAGAAVGNLVEILDASNNALGTAVVGSNGLASVQLVNPLSEQAHSLVAREVNAQGATIKTSSASNVAVDTTAPATAPVISGIANDADALTNDTTPTVQGTAAANGVVQLYLDGSTTPVRVVANGSGAWSWTPLLPLTQGAHNVRAVQEDAAGNASGSGNLLNFTVDSGVAAPTVTVLSTTNNTASPLLQGTAEAGAQVTISANGSTLGAVTADSTGAWRYLLTGQSNGALTMSVTQTDVAGNVSLSTAVTATVNNATAAVANAYDTLGPWALTTASDTGVLNTDRITRDDTPTVQGSGAVAGATVRVFNGNAQVGEAVADSSGNWSLSTSALPNGAVNMTAQQVKPDGSLGLASTLAVTVDTFVLTGVPSLSGSTSVNGVNWVNTTKPALTGGNNEAGARVELLNASGSVVGQTTVLANGSWRVSPSQDLAQGAHSLSVRVTDVAGNVSANSPSLSFSVDSQMGTPAAPTLAAGFDSGSSANDGVTRVGSVTLLGQGAEAGATLTVYNGAIALGTTTVGLDGQWTLNANLPAGSHTLRTQQRDVAGNVSALSGALSLVVDNSVTALTAPTLLSNSDTGTVGDSTTTNALARVSGAGAEADASIDVYADGVYVGSTQANASGAWSFAPAGIWGSGAINVTAVQTDAAGNVSAASSALALSITSQPLALTAPTLATVSAVAATNSAAVITASTTPTVQGVGATPGATVTVYSVDGSGNLSSLGTVQAGSDGAWTLQLPTQTTGTTLNLRATQTVRGQESPTSASLSLKVDTAALGNTAITLSSASDGGVVGDRITKDSTPTLQGTLNGQANATLTISKDGGTVGQALTDANGNWGFTVPTDLANGVHSFTVTPSGGSASQALVLTVDTAVSTLARPVLSANSDTGTSASDGITHLRNVTLTGTGAEAGAQVEALLGGVVVGRGVAGADGSYSVQVQGLADGSNAVTVRQTDIAGNQSAVSLTAQLEVKTSAAAPEILGLSTATDSGVQGDNVTNNTNPVVLGRGAEANANVSLWLGSTLLGQAQANANGAWRVTVSGLPAGVHNLVAKQTDVAGNLSTGSSPYVLKIDTNAAAPTLGLLNTGDNDTGIMGDGRTQNDQPIFSGVAEAGAAITLWRTDQGTPVAVASAIADTSGNWQAQWSQKLLPSNYSFAVSQTDVSGNTSFLSQSSALTVQSRVDLNLSSLLAGGSSASLRLQDLNGDGLTDVVAGQVFYQQANGSFEAGMLKLAMPTRLSNGVIVIGKDWGQFFDIDGDGKEDFIGWAPEIVSSEGVRHALQMVGGNYANSLTGTLTSVAGISLPSLVINGGVYAQLAADKLVGISGNTTGNRPSLAWDVNRDGYMDVVYGDSSVGVLKNTGNSNFISTSAMFTGNMYSIGVAFDANNDGWLDYYDGYKFYLASGGYGFTALQYQTALSGLPADSDQASHVMVADFNADGKEDVAYGLVNQNLRLFLNQGAVFSEQSTSLVFEQGSIVLSPDDSISLVAGDIDGNRSLDLLYQSTGGVLQVKRNQTQVAENTYLRVVVTDELGSFDRMSGVSVQLFDSSSGALVATRVVGATVKGAYTSQPGNLYAEFFGLDPAKTYDVAVRYPGNDQGVIVVSGRANLGADGINPGVLRNIVDSNLQAVSPAGKDVIYVAPERVTTATTGGKHIGSQYADDMVGDAGNDVFTPNGVPLGEVGDTIDLRNGGSDTIVFQQVGNLNTAATVLGANLSAALSAGGDVIDVAGLLTAMGYTGQRNATDVASVLRVVADGTGLKLQANKPGVGFQDLAHVQPPTGGDISGLTLANLVSSGHLRLGGLGLSGVRSLTVDEDTAQLGGLGLFGSVVLTAEGGVYAQGFHGGSLRVSLDRAYAEDHWSVTAGNGVTVAGTTVSVDGSAVATVDATANGQGTDFLLSFNFSGSSLTAAEQAAVVERVAHAIDYTNAGSTPPDYARAVKLTVSDGSSTAMDASLMTVTPIADTEVLGGARTITGTAAVDTLNGSAANDVFVGYGGPVGSAGTTSATGDTLTGGGGADTFVYRMANVGKDTITDFGVRGVAGLLTANEDVINVHDLLKGYVSGTSELSDYVRLVDNGSSVSVKVDFNGKADGSVFQSYMEVQLSGVTLSNTGATDVDALRLAMITHGQLVI